MGSLTTTKTHYLQWQMTTGMGSLLEAVTCSLKDVGLQVGSSTVREMGCQAKRLGDEFVQEVSSKRRKRSTGRWRRSPKRIVIPGRGDHADATTSRGIILNRLASILGSRLQLLLTPMVHHQRGPVLHQVLGRSIEKSSEMAVNMEEAVNQANDKTQQTLTAGS